MKISNILNKIGEKSAARTIGPLCFPRGMHQPTPPKKIQEAINKNK